MNAQRNCRESDRPFREVVRDYLPRPDILGGDDEMHALWHVVAHLPTPDRNLLILYAELGSFRKVAQRFGVTHPTISKKLHRIQEDVRRGVEALRR